MTKDERIAAAQCPAGGAHHWMMYWRGQEYRGRCQKCHEDKAFDYKDARLTMLVGTGREPR